MLLDCEGSGQQALKGLLVELQLGPVRGHENGGTILRTVLIILQFRRLGERGNLAALAESGYCAQIRGTGAGSIPDWGLQSGTDLMKRVWCGRMKMEAEDVSGVFTRALV